MASHKFKSDSAAKHVIKKEKKKSGFQSFLDFWFPGKGLWT